MSKPVFAYERCPHCKADIGVHLQRQWEYEDEFDIECPKCGKGVGVTVEQSTSFRCSTMTNAEAEEEAVKMMVERMKREYP